MMLRRIPRLNSLLSRLYSSTSSRGLYSEQLTDRGIIEIKGNDASQFLQGLITNDMNHLGEGSKCMYSLILNTQGRLMYDCLIYKVQDSYLLECDLTSVDTIKKHFQMYRVRRKIDINNISDTLKPWVVFEQLNISDVRHDHAQNGLVLCGPEPVRPKKPLTLLETEQSKDAVSVGDPRMIDLGWRLLLHEGLCPTKIVPSVNIINPNKDITYKKLRHVLGVAEGASDFNPGKCFPLEANGDYMHGISFHKGCYVGQELTARTYHTGVVRKRFMPISFDKPVDNVELDTNIVNEKNKNIGKLKSYHGMLGIGLLRIDDSLKSVSLKVGDINVKTHKPKWWPIEAPKESQIQNKKE